MFIVLFSALDRRFLCHFLNHFFLSISSYFGKISHNEYSILHKSFLNNILINLFNIIIVLSRNHL